MAIENTVTISIDEYFDLRQKAYMNDFLIGELNRIHERYMTGRIMNWQKK